jgi:hypothetical protein
LLHGWGLLDETQGLEVTATAAADGSLRGTLRNTTDHTLRQLLVMVGNRYWDGDTLGPGEELEWALGPDEGLADPWGNEPIEDPWRAAMGWDGEPDLDHPVNYELWTAARSRLADPHAPGWVTAAGWTRDWSPPVDPGAEIDRGRTVFTTQAPVAAEAGAIPGDAVRRELLRGAEVTEVPQPAGGDESAAQQEEDGVLVEEPQGDWGPSAGAVVRFDLPTTADPATPLEVDAPGAVLAVEAWDGTRWVPLAEPAGRDVNLANVDPYDPTAARALPVPAGAVRDGAVYLRAQIYESTLTGVMNFEVREAR